MLCLDDFLNDSLEHSQGAEIVHLFWPDTESIVIGVLGLEGCMSDLQILEA